MAKDYKHRSHSRRRDAESAVWKWVAVGALLGMVAVLAYQFRDRTPDRPATASAQPEAADGSGTARDAGEAPEQDEGPRFEFYTLLPENEVVVPEHEIKARKREEKLGQSKPGHYILQAGSFRSLQEADRLKAQLALLGVEARIETAKIGDAVWNRIKIGPFGNLAEVDKIRTRLRKNRIDAVVIQEARR